MNVIKRLFPGFSLFFFLSFSLLSQQVSAQTTCEARAPSRVEAGQTFEYKVTLNERPQKIAATSFNNFRVVGGPSQSSSSSISIINGQTTRQNAYTYSYYLQAEKAGTYTIPGTAFILNGKQINSNSVTITVVEASVSRSSGQNTTQQGAAGAVSSSPNLDKNELFIRATASNSKPYQGEQVLITYKLYIGPAVNGGFQVTNINLPSQNNLWSYQLGDQNAEPSKSYETIEGKRYTVLEIRRTAVFPQKSGEITITPLEMDVVARVIYQTQQATNIWDQFFGGGQRAQDHQLSIKSNPLKLNVMPCPERNKPDQFNGLVGNFSIKSNLSRSELKANDATNLTISISGNGNLQHVEGLKVSFPPDFDITDPKINDQINTSGSTVSGSRSFEYVLIPRTSGEFTIPPVTFHFFDPKTKSYKTLSTEKYLITVEKGEGEHVVTSTFSNQKEIKMIDRDIRYIKQSPDAFKKLSSPFFKSSYYYFLLLCPPLLFCLFLFFWKRHSDARRDVVRTRDKKANKVALKRLKKASLLLKENEEEAFYNEISRALWGYMSDKFHIPLSRLSMESVEEKLIEKKLDNGSIQAFLKTLHQCEFARFAPGDSRQIMQEMYEQTLSFITNIEKKQ